MVVNLSIMILFVVYILYVCCVDDDVIPLNYCNNVNVTKMDDNFGR